MSQHYTRLTVSATVYCAKCQRPTEHRVDNRRVGPCLRCIERLTAEGLARRADDLVQTTEHRQQMKLFAMEDQRR